MYTYKAEFISTDHGSIMLFIDLGFGANTTQGVTLSGIAFENQPSLAGVSDFINNWVPENKQVILFSFKTGDVYNAVIKKDGDSRSLNEALLDANLADRKR